jgi:hypothetical protein
LERGIRLARIDTVLKLAGALEIEPGEFFNGMDWSPGGRPSGTFTIKSDAGEGASDEG